LKRHLPADWHDKVDKIFHGTAIKFWTLSRIDLLGTKIWALCDRRRDFDDVLAKNPTDDELIEAEKWLAPLD
jgi:hypothetical protein